MSDRDSHRGYSHSPSGYGRDQSRGGYSAQSGETSSGSSRRRSRSPEGGSRYSQSSSSRGPGRQGYGGSGPYSSRSGGQSGAHDDLPNSVPIPDGGKELEPQQMTPRNPNGKRLHVKTNHFLIQSLPVSPLKIYQYSMRFKIPPSSQRKDTAELTKQQLARAFMVLEATNTFGPNFVFDNVSTGWCNRELMPVDTTQSATINMPGHNSQKPTQITVTVRADGALDLSPMVNWLRAGNTGQASENMAVSKVLKALNSIFRDYPANKKRWITRPNSSAFFERAEGLVFALPSTDGILEAIRGVYQSVSVGFGGNLCVNVDNACSAFYVPGLCLLDIAKAFAGTDKRDPLTSNDSSDRFRLGCERIVGLFFVVRHTRTKKEDESGLGKIPGLHDPKRMRVQSLTRGDANNTIFPITDPTTGEESEISVASYFKRRYSHDLRYPNIPLVHTARDGDIPMELCFTPEGERYKELLQGQETADFIRVCTSPANVRRDQIRQHLDRLGWHRQPLLQHMGISVQTKMLTVRAQQLPAPIPQYRTGTDRQAAARGSWNLMGKTFVEPSRFMAWGVLYFPLKRKLPEEQILNFCRAFENRCQDFGLQTPRRQPPVLAGNHQGDVTTMIEELSSKVCGEFQVPKPHLLLIFMHQGTSPALYKMIKNVCEIQGIPTQGMTVEKSILSSSSGQSQYLANVAMKVNVKLGGANQFVREDKLFNEPIMMIGADISHPSPSELRRTAPPPSFAAVVASYDKYCSQFTGLTAAQATTEHIITNMKPIITELVERFRAKHNGTVPKRIIYWRDGLGESQVTAFKDIELKAFDEIRKEKGANFKLTAINCLKKHKTRFFPEENAASDKHGNVLPCTVVENSVLNNDFYTVTQAALQGCCVPTHYISIVDENDLSPADIQRLVVNSCFAYQRATRSVKVVPAVYYAHQVADRAKMHLREENGRTVLHDVGKDLKYTMYWQ